jgi:hypothetical protein
VKLDAIKAGAFCVCGVDPEILDDAGNFSVCSVRGTVLIVCYLIR